MFKKSLLVTAILSLFLSACSSSTDYRYKREIEGSDEYLKSAKLKTMVVPEGISIPIESGEFYIYKASSENATGKEIDIRPPELPIPAAVDSYASYQNGMVIFEAPNYLNFWQDIPVLLQQQQVAIENQDGNSIKTGLTTIRRGDEPQSVNASYLIQRKASGSQDIITFELTSLKRDSQDVTNVIETQYYTVEFFNLLMRQYQLKNNKADNSEN